jgi:hypothetical protein
LQRHCFRAQARFLHLPHRLGVAARQILPARAAPVQASPSQPTLTLYCGFLSLAVLQNPEAAAIAHDQIEVVAIRDLMSVLTRACGFDRLIDFFAGAGASQPTKHLRSHRAAFVRQDYRRPHSISPFDSD